MIKQSSERGITLLITLLFMSVLLGITATLLNVSLKQWKIASIGLASEISFQAAQAGLECAIYHDFNTLGQDFTGDGTADAYVFQVPADGSSQPDLASISCMGKNDTAAAKAASGEEQRFDFSWGTDPNGRCTSVSVYKFRSGATAVDMIINSTPIKDKNNNTRQCPADGECTVIKSRGYNVGCADIPTAGRVVERELTQVY